MNEMTFDEFHPLLAAEKEASPRIVIVVPDATSQAMLQSRFPLVTIKRRDEWLARSQNQHAELQLLEKHILIQTAVNLLHEQGGLQNPVSSLQNLSFSESFFALSEEITSAGVLDPTARKELFSVLSDNAFFQDLYSILEVLEAAHLNKSQLSDSQRLLELFLGEEQGEAPTPLYYVGFHRLSWLEKEVLQKLSRTRPVTLVLHPPPQFSEEAHVRRFEHYRDECQWIGAQVRKHVEADRFSSIGIVLPPEPNYEAELCQQFGVPQNTDPLFPLLNWYEAAFSILSWQRHPRGLVNPEKAFLRLPLSRMLKDVLSKNLLSLIKSCTSPWDLFETLSSELASQRTEEEKLQQLYDFSFRATQTRVEFTHLEKPLFWTNFFKHLKESPLKAKAQTFALKNTRISLLDYRCVQFSNCEIHFMPGVAHRIYPPRLPDHPILGERQRKFLRESAFAFPFIDAATRMEDEAHFFQHNVAPGGKPATLTSSVTTGLSAETPLSPFLGMLDGGFREELVSDTGGRNRNANRDWNCVSKKRAVFPGEAKTVFSSSRLETYLRCPFQYFLQKEFGLDDVEESEYLTALDTGALVHRWLEVLLREPDRKLNFECFKEICASYFPEHIREAPKHIGFVEKQFFLAWEPFVARERQRLKDLGRKPVYFEHGFKNFEFAPGKTLRGRIDRIDENAEGYVVVDYKSGKKSLTQKDKKGDGILLQPFLYRDVVAKEFGTDKVTSEYVYLREEEPVQVFPDVNLSEKLQKIVDHIDLGHFEPTPATQSTCTFCTFRISCPTGAAK